MNIDKLESAINTGDIQIYDCFNRKIQVNDTVCTCHNGHTHIYKIRKLNNKSLKVLQLNKCDCKKPYNDFRIPYKKNSLCIINTEIKNLDIQLTEQEIISNKKLTKKQFILLKIITTSSDSVYFSIKKINFDYLRKRIIT